MVKVELDIQDDEKGIRIVKVGTTIYYAKDPNKINLVVIDDDVIVQWYLCYSNTDWRSLK